MKKSVKQPKELYRAEITRTSDGKVISFKEYLCEIEGTPDLYRKEVREILMGWKRADAAYVFEYIAPMAADILIDTHELNPELYASIMRLIEEAYHLNRVQIDPSHPILEIIE